MRLVLAAAAALVLAATAPGCSCADRGLFGAGPDAAPGDAAGPGARDAAAARDRGLDGGPAPDAGAASCAAQDARPIAACATVIGFVWDGSNCLALGCECVGTDCGGLAPTMTACVEAHRSCYRATCAPQPVTQSGCEYCGSGAPRAFWDGVQCFAMDACGCQGEGCDAAFRSLDECAAFHVRCDASLCRGTGGVFHPAEPCGPCGDYLCGVPPPEPCCYAGCDCGPGRSFAAGQGCVVDLGCDDPSFCQATGGTWAPLNVCQDYVCGEATGPLCQCDPPGPGPDPCDHHGCDCGPHRTFAGGRGCEPDPACVATLEQICQATGGTVDPMCDGYRCGELVAVGACDRAGCNCGPGRNYDAQRGCVVAADCLLPGDVGDSCRGDCRPGLVCCPTSGVMASERCLMPQPCCHDGDYGCASACPPPPP
ncbi:MAG TPA: hypothetical protein VGQ83_26495 [Polyangia bacterium]|jgi:hypothetical protein